MRVHRDTDARLAHGRPDGWWARVNWDYAHKTQEERQEDGARNLGIIIAVIAGAAIVGLIALSASITGSLTLGIFFWVWFLIRAGYRKRRWHCGYW